MEFLPKPQENQTGQANQIADQIIDEATSVVSTPTGQAQAGKPHDDKASENKAADEKASENKMASSPAADHSLGSNPAANHTLGSNPAADYTAHEVSAPEEKTSVAASANSVSTPVMPAKVICIVNQKGGVGKTTTAINLAASLVQLGKKSLVIDIDPQGNATSGLGVAKTEAEATLFDLLAGEAGLRDILHPGPVDDLFVAPSNNDLLSVEWQLASDEDGKTRLRAALLDYLGALDGSWRPDYILIDCPPSLGLLTINAVLASNAIIIPVQCEYYALEGLVDIIRSTTLLRSQMNPGLSLEGILLTMADKRLNLSQSVEADIRNAYSGHVFQEVIYRSVRLSEAPSHGLPILMYDPDSKGAHAYISVAEEIIRNETQSPRPWPVRSAI